MLECVPAALARRAGWARLVGLTLILGVHKFEEGRADRPNMLQPACLKPLHHSSLGFKECLFYYISALVPAKETEALKHLCEYCPKDGCRLRVHKRRPADAVLETRTVLEKGVSDGRCLAAVEDDQPKVTAS